MATCTNPKTIDTANVLDFGFQSIFNPYAKTLKFDISSLTVFQGGGAANISEINFTVTTPIGDTLTATIDPSASETDVTITGMDGASLYFGLYHIVGVLVEANASEYTIEFDVNVCHDNNLTAQNFIQGCLQVDADCGSATLVVSETSKNIYAGLSPNTELTTWDGAIVYPTNYLPQVDFTYAPYQLNIENSITGLYQVSMVKTNTYELDCNAILLIQYRSNVNKDVQCTDSICDLTCCWSDAIAMVEQGGSRGAQMAEKLQEAEPYYNLAFGLWKCGKNNDDVVAKVKKILNCDCKCEKSLVITARPIVYGNANLIGDCGTTITQDDNGDYLFHSFVYQVISGDSKLSVTTTQINDCTKRTTITVNCAAIERCIYDILADSDNIDILNEWRDLFDITACACDGVSVVSTTSLVGAYVTNSDLDRLDDTYFTRNHIISYLRYLVTNAVTGGTLSFASYYDQLIGNGGQVTANGNLIIPANVCGNDLIENDAVTKLIHNVQTTCGCAIPNECDINVLPVAYSERYDFGYRFNPSIINPPYRTYPQTIDGENYTMVELFINDTYYDNAATSTGGTVRSVIFKTDSGGSVTLYETRTLIGRQMLGVSPVTLNNVWGNEAEFNYNSSVNIDLNEMVNNYPVLYFVTTNGCICRAVRERDNQCDERANWKVYIIGGSDGGDVLYNMKYFMADANGHAAFLYVNNITDRVYAFCYDGLGSKNSAANWTSAWVIYQDGTGLSVFGGTTKEVQVDDNGTDIYTLSDGRIHKTEYVGTDAVSDILDNTNYVVYQVCITASASSTNYFDGLGGTATLNRPNCLFKIGTKYYFGNARSNDIGGSYLRYFEITTEAARTPNDFTFDTEIVPQVSIGAGNSNLCGGSWVTDTSSTVSAETFGMVNIPNLGWISFYRNGLRLFNFTGKTVTVYTGQATGGGNLVDTDPLMDTQWEYSIDCDPAN